MSETIPSSLQPPWPGGDAPAGSGPGPVADPWSNLRRFTNARIALGRTGGSLPTQALLDFRLAHARACDAVITPFDPQSLTLQLERFGLPVVLLASAAADKTQYLQRPDLGRQLCPDSRSKWRDAAARIPACDLVVIVSDGLSTEAVNTQAVPLLGALLPRLQERALILAPLVVVRHGRVALQDEIGAACQARISLMLLGERPGLGSADSLGAYFTFGPAPGKTDADRNCVSNIRPEGLNPIEAAAKLDWLLGESLRRSVGGVALKDEAGWIGRSGPGVSGTLPGWDVF